MIFPEFSRTPPVASTIPTRRDLSTRHRGPAYHGKGSAGMWAAQVGHEGTPRKPPSLLGSAIPPLILHRVWRFGGTVRTRVGWPSRLCGTGGGPK